MENLDGRWGACYTGNHRVDGVMKYTHSILYAVKHDEEEPHIVIVGDCCDYAWTAKTE